MPVKPTPEQAMLRLRLEPDVAEEVPDAIDQAQAEAQAFLDGALYEDATAVATAQDARGIVCTPDIIAAQLLLVDVLIGNNTPPDRAAKRAAAQNMLLRHRNMGA